MLNIHINHSDKQIRYNICAINDCAHNKYNIHYNINRTIQKQDHKS